MGALLFIGGLAVGLSIHGPLGPAARGTRPRRSIADYRGSAPEIATLRQLVPTNSTIMMDVQWHWTNLWWAGKRRNWPLAQCYFNEGRSHIQQLVRKNPTIRNAQDGTDVELQGIFDGIDTSSLAMVKSSIERRTARSSRRTTRSCSRAATRATRASAGRTSVRSFRPAQVQAMVNMDPNATWPQ